MPKKDDPKVIAELNRWAAEVSHKLDMPQKFDEDTVNVGLALTGQAAVEIVRPAAPFAALFAGYLYGAGKAGSLEEAMEMIVQLIREEKGED